MNRITPTTRGNYILEFREPGKRPGTTRAAKILVDSTREAVEWMNADRDNRFTPAAVVTKSWKRPDVVAILG